MISGAAHRNNVCAECWEQLGPWPAVPELWRPGVWWRGTETGKRQGRNLKVPPTLQKADKAKREVQGSLLPGALGLERGVRSGPEAWVPARQVRVTQQALIYILSLSPLGFLSKWLSHLTL